MIQIIGDTIEYDGYRVGTLSTEVPPSVRARFEADLLEGSDLLNTPEAEDED